MNPVAVTRADLADWLQDHAHHDAAAKLRCGEAVEAIRFVLDTTPRPDDHRLQALHALLRGLLAGAVLLLEEEER